MLVAAVADDTPWHYALGGIWGLIAMIMATLAVLVAGHALISRVLRFVFGRPAPICPLDSIQESLDWQFKIAMASDKRLDLWRREDCRARLLEIENRLNKGPYRPWYKRVLRHQTALLSPPPCPPLPAPPPRRPPRRLRLRRLPHRFSGSGADFHLSSRQRLRPLSLDLDPSTTDDLAAWRRQLFGDAET